MFAAGDVAVMAAQAEHDAADFGTRQRSMLLGRTSMYFPLSPKAMRHAVQRAGVLAPQCIVAGIVSVSAVAGAEGAAMRGSGSQRNHGR